MELTSSIYGWDRQHWLSEWKDYDKRINLDDFSPKNIIASQQLEKHNKEQEFQFSTFAEQKKIKEMSNVIARDKLGREGARAITMMHGCI